jgi:Tol biopolymer transport system component
MAMQRRYLPEIGDRKMTREFATPTVTRRGEDATLLLGANLSPDGQQLAYISDRNLNHELFVRQIDGPGQPRCLVEGETSGDFEALRFFAASTAWSLDGKTLAFSAKSGGQDALYLLDAASGKVQTKLTFGLDEVQTATFSPDGSEIIFVGLSQGQSDLYRVHRDGTGLRRVTQDRFAERDPQWSPDGHSLVYVTDAGPETDFAALEFGRMHLVQMDLEAGTVRDIRRSRSGGQSAWSGDGIVGLVSDQDGVSNIHILHLPTGQVFRLTDSTTGVRHPADQSGAVVGAPEQSLGVLGVR